MQEVMIWEVPKNSVIDLNNIAMPRSFENHQEFFPTYFNFLG